MFGVSVRAAALLGIGVVLCLGCGSRGDAGGSPLAHRAPSVTTFAREAQRLTDGVVAAGEAPWNSRLACMFEGSGSVEWDLGRVETLARVYVQADNNDHYALVVSSDGRRWTTAWEAPPVPGVGLQARQVEGLSVRARYVRLEPRGGDGQYSASEFVVSGPSAPWPPVLEAVDGRASDDPAYPGLRHRLLFALFVLCAALLPVLVRPASWLALAWCGAVLMLFVAGAGFSYAAKYCFNLVDDAYISLQYARNWVDGLGLVFNPGERVEGYTNFLWVALLTPFWPLTGRDPDAFTRAAIGLGLALAVLSLGLVLVTGRRVFKTGALATAVALLLLAFDDSYVAYAAMFGLENHLLVVLMLIALALVVYRPRGFAYALGVTFALIGMTRPDGLLFAGTFFVAGLPLPGRLRGEAADAERIDFETWLRAGLSCALPFGIYFTCRALYFGDLLPNTFYLKVGHDLNALPRGLAYVREYVAERFFVPLLGLLAVLLTRTLWVRWLVLFVVLHVIYVIYVGGDFYAGHRFLLVVTPCLALLQGALFDCALACAQPPLLRWAGALAAAVAVLAVQFGSLRHGPYTTELHGFLPRVDNNVKYMQWLGTVARPKASFALGDIGAAGLFSDLPVIDTYGVVDRAIARKQVPGFGTGKAGHEKMATRAEILARRPTYLKWGYIDAAAMPSGYYVFNDFPPHLMVEGLWVRDDLAKGHDLAETAVDFSAAQLVHWTRTGDAFARAPSSGAAAGQMRIAGQRGLFVDSFTDGAGDRATGRLLSPPFALIGDRMRLRVGGGRDPERLSVSLLVDGKRVFSATGTNQEVLGRREWDIASLRGRSARIEIVDQATAAWGHILVDELVQWTGQPNTSGKL